MSPRATRRHRGERISMTVVFDTVAVSRGQDAILAFSCPAATARIRGQARYTDKAGSVLKVWDHIYPLVMTRLIRCTWVSFRG
jgi:hypothetical protein